MRCKPSVVAALLAAAVLHGAGAVAAAPEAMDPQRMSKMQESMLKMHDLMHRLQAAKSPEERQKLQQEHLQLMQAHMKEMMPMMMHGMGGGMTGGAPARK